MSEGLDIGSTTREGEIAPGDKTNTSNSIPFIVLMSTLSPAHVMFVLTIPLKTQ